MSSNTSLKLNMQSKKRSASPGRSRRSQSTTTQSARSQSGSSSSITQRSRASLQSFQQDMDHMLGSNSMENTMNRRMNAVTSFQRQQEEEREEKRLKKEADKQKKLQYARQEVHPKVQRLGTIMNLKEAKNLKEKEEAQYLKQDSQDPKYVSTLVAGEKQLPFGEGKVWQPKDSLEQPSVVEQVKGELYSWAADQKLHALIEDLGKDVNWVQGFRAHNKLASGCAANQEEEEQYLDTLSPNQLKLEGCIGSKEKRFECEGPNAVPCPCFDCMFKRKEAARQLKQYVQSEEADKQEKLNTQSSGNNRRNKRVPQVEVTFERDEPLRELLDCSSRRLLQNTQNKNVDALMEAMGGMSLEDRQFHEEQVSRQKIVKKNMLKKKQLNKMLEEGVRKKMLEEGVKKEGAKYLAGNETGNETNRKQQKEVKKTVVVKDSEQDREGLDNLSKTVKNQAGRRAPPLPQQFLATKTESREHKKPDLQQSAGHAKQKHVEDVEPKMSEESDESNKSFLQLKSIANTTANKLPPSEIAMGFAGVSDKNQQCLGRFCQKRVDLNARLAPMQPVRMGGERAEHIIKQIEAKFSEQSDEVMDEIMSEIEQIQNNFAQPDGQPNFDQSMNNAQNFLELGNAVPDESNKSFLEMQSQFTANKLPPSEIAMGFAGVSDKNQQCLGRFCQKRVDLNARLAPMQPVRMGGESAEHIIEQIEAKFSEQSDEVMDEIMDEIEQIQNNFGQPDGQPNFDQSMNNAQNFLEFGNAVPDESNKSFLEMQSQLTANKLPRSEIAMGFAGVSDKNQQCLGRFCQKRVDLNARLAPMQPVRMGGEGAEHIIEQIEAKFSEQSDEVMHEIEQIQNNFGQPDGQPNFDQSMNNAQNFLELGNGVPTTELDGVAMGSVAAVVGSLMWALKSAWRQ